MIYSIYVASRKFRNILYKSSKISLFETAIGMKIGILTSSNDMFALFDFLQKKNHEYVVWYDDSSAFWGDVSQSVVIDRVRVGMDFLLSKGVDVVIVPPVVELILNA